ncbi:protein telomere ends associated-like [Drosophila ficusphila]|uniref:protein telomere ends associated-like n=1 Tax=Drosophila ficusphila TaxID=30025 RepID=UPI0007E87F51|nr:protein telomere ends associated-like [Drosophila ficusphila]
MSALKALRERSLNNSKSSDQIFPVTFKTFKRLIANLSKIATALRSADGNHKTDDEWAHWYYEAFYRDPSIREKYKFEVAPCPHHIREKLLTVPDPELIMNAGKQKEINQPISKQEVNATSEANKLPGNLKLGSEDQIVKVNTLGTFVFPVSFRTFEGNLNKKVVFLKIIKNRQHGLMLLGNYGYCRSTLRNFYNRYYIFPRFREKTNYFKEVPSTPLAKLLEFGRAYDDIAAKTVRNHELISHKIESLQDSKNIPLKLCQHPDPNIVIDLTEPHNETANQVLEVSKNAKEPLRNDLICRPPVSIKMFRSHVSNLKDIVHQMLQCVEYHGKSEESCIQEYYKGFYSRPEMREKFVPRLKACPAKLREKLLSFPPKLNEQCSKEAACQENPNSGNEIANTNKEVPPQESNTTNTSRSGNQYYDDTLIRLSNNHYQFPVSFRTFKLYVNSDELMDQLVNDSFGKTNTAEQLAEIRKDNVRCVRLLHRFFHSFYVKKDIRNRFKFNFAAAPSEMAQKLQEWAVLISDSEDQKQSQSIRISQPESKGQAPDEQKKGRQCPNESYEARKLELASKTKIDLVQYIPDNLYAYLCSDCKSPQERAILENEFLEYLLTQKGGSFMHDHLIAQVATPATSRSNAVEIGSIVHFRPPAAEELESALEQHEFLKCSKEGKATSVLKTLPQTSSLSECSPNCSRSSSKCDTGNKDRSSTFLEKNLTNKNLDFPVESTALHVPILEKQILIEKAKERTIDLDGSQNQNIQPIFSSEDAFNQESSGTPTQPTESTFVNVATGNQAYQSTEIPSDLPMAAGIADVCQSPKEPMSLNVVTIKQEPIKFLSNERCVCYTDDCQWEKIDSEEQIIDLDGSQKEETSLLCFCISKLKEQMPDKMGNLLLEESLLGNNDNADEDVAAATQEVDTDDFPCTSETKRKSESTSEAVPIKRIKLEDEQVPQVRHGFSDLPLNAMVRIESEGAKHVDPSDNTSPQPLAPNITPSQEFATGNTLLESTQLHMLLDSTNINTRKVIEKEVNSASLGVCDQAPSRVCNQALQSSVIFLELQRFSFFKSLTVPQIIRNRIEGHLEGACYQEALVKIDGRRSYLRGPLLQSLFPHLSPTLRSDLEHLLRNMEEFSYHRFWKAHTNSTLDLRTRVLYVFMDVAAKFGPFHVMFDNNTKEWATCSEIVRWEDEEAVNQGNPCNVTQFINPCILKRIKELKEIMG